MKVHRFKQTKNYISCLIGSPPVVEFHIAGKYSSALNFNFF